MNNTRKMTICHLHIHSCHIIPFFYTFSSYKAQKYCKFYTKQLIVVDTQPTCLNYYSICCGWWYRLFIFCAYLWVYRGVIALSGIDHKTYCQFSSTSASASFRIYNSGAREEFLHDVVGSQLRPLLYCQAICSATEQHGLWR